MRILHAPKNIAGQATIISRGQRRLGVQSDVAVFDQNRMNFECDYVYNLSKFPGFLRPLVKLAFFPFFFIKYDVFHFHYGTTLLPKNFDLAIFTSIGKALGKRTVMEYWGSDIIQSDVAKHYTLFDERTFAEVFPNLDNEKRRKTIARTNRLVGAHIVGDYSLKPFSPDSLVIRQVLDCKELPFIGCEQKGDEINIVHAPTNRNIKGTDKILKEIEALRKQGHQIKVTLVENLPHQQAIEMYKGADIVIDDVLQGPYGIFAMECMALGKPVLCRIDEKLVSCYKDLPIVNTPPEKIQDNLMMLMASPDLRKELGRRGREYVEKNHDADVIARQLLTVYDNI
jgi:glycosyltransferase involved in cell wall biosynthesis